MHELDGVEVIDTDYEELLEDTFVFPAESGDADDLIFEIMDVACCRPHKSEELSDEAMCFIANPKNKKSTESHSRCQNQHEKSYKGEENRKLDLETTLVNHFTNLVNMRKCGPGTM